LTTIKLAGIVGMQEEKHTYKRFHCLNNIQRTNVQKWTSIN